MPSIHTVVRRLAERGDIVVLQKGAVVELTEGAELKGIYRVRTNENYLAGATADPWLGAALPVQPVQPTQPD